MLGPWPARAENHLTIAPDDFGLHEEVAEDRMGQVGVLRRKDDLGVTGQFDPARPA